MLADIIPCDINQKLTKIMEEQMIKILNQKAQEKKVYNITCHECGAQLEYEESDTYIGANGGRNLICPSCGEELYLDEPKGIDLDENNINFPVHFYAMGDDVVNIKDCEIQNMVRHCLARIKENPDNSFFLEGTGDTMVIVLAFEDEYDIYVTKNYWECSIPKYNEII